jgi:DNA polymerase IIIc chi subunit
MSEIHFYHLQIHPLDRALPKLLEKSLERDWHVCLQMRTPEKCAALNELLWNVGEDGFLPHGTAEDGDVEFQPIYLTIGSENPNGAQIRFFVECAQKGVEMSSRLDQHRHGRRRLVGFAFVRGRVESFEEPIRQLVRFGGGTRRKSGVNVTIARAGE